MTDRRSFRFLFLCAFWPQLLLCIAYWALGVDPGGGGTSFGDAVMMFYLPAAYLAFIPGALLGGWAGIGFAQITTPLVGALLYSAASAGLVRAIQRGSLGALLALFRDGT